MEVKQYTKVLVWDWNKCPEYKGFPYYGGQTILVCDWNKCPAI